MVLGLSLAIGLLATSVSETDSLALYKPFEYHFTGGKYENQIFRYRLLGPQNGESKRQYPLFVWLHGLREGGDDNVSQLRYLDTLLTPAPWEASRFPFYILALQSPPDTASWGAGDTGSGDDMLSVLERILDDTLESYPIDRDRVYLAGVSGGGEGCWRFASRRPDYFAAVAPLSGRGFLPTAQQLAALKQMPIWVFNCNGDAIAPIEPVRQLVHMIASERSKIHLTEIDSASHDSWTTAFIDYDLRTWLLAQRRGDSLASPPGQIGWRQEMQVFFRRPICDLLRGWTWPQLSALGYLSVVAVVVGRRACKGRRSFKKIRIRASR